MFTKNFYMSYRGMRVTKGKWRNMKSCMDYAQFMQNMQLVSTMDKKGKKRMKTRDGVERISLQLRLYIIYI